MSTAILSCLSNDSEKLAKTSAHDGMKVVEKLADSGAESEDDLLDGNDDRLPVNCH